MDIKGFLYNNSSISTIKRKTYLVVFPIFIVTFLFLTYLLYSAGNLDLINSVTFGSLSIGFVVCYLLLFIHRDSLLFIDILICIITAFITLLRTYNTILLDLGRYGDMHLGTFSYWMPLVYIMIFFTFRGKTALLFSFTNFALSLIPGLYHIFYSEHASAQTLDTLLQYYVSILGLIICLYFVQHMFEIFMQADAAKQLANTDYLTSIYNRRKMDTVLISEITRVANTKESLSAILFDVDNFKKINDQYGHDVGDSVLKELTEIINKQLPKNTYFGRWGGEEFLLISSGTSINELAEQVRVSISQHNFNGIDKPVTCSFGVATLLENELAKDIVSRADEALYKAKENGKNQVCIAS
ncbi:GGDEF domain-containing protein [Cytobacillus suaedae]|nr:GGDEF domain-containing protein [Cytobacillus suaedae]